MYAARFELAAQRWRVYAGRVQPPGAGVPGELLAALAEGRLEHAGIRRRYGPGAEGWRAELLIPVPDHGEAPPADALRARDAVTWCASADAFDALALELGPCRRWLDAPELSHAAIPFVSEATWAPDDEWFGRQAGAASVVHQTNIAYRPVDPEERRQLLKHLARLDGAAAEGLWPQAKIARQRALIQRRLASPWLADELVACADEAVLLGLSARLSQRLREQAGQPIDDLTLHEGSFEEMLHTGLASATLLQSGALTNVAHAVAVAPLWGRIASDQRDRSESDKAIDIFLSHASRDAELARSLCAQLESRGLRCWIAPRNIAAGGHYAEAIEQALQQSRGLVLLLSEAGLGSGHVLRELERAVHHRAAVLPVRLSALEPRGAFGYLLSGCQWTDAIDSVDAGLIAGRLVEGLRGGSAPAGG